MCLLDEKLQIRHAVAGLKEPGAGAVGIDIIYILLVAEYVEVGGFWQITDDDTLLGGIGRKRDGDGARKLRDCRSGLLAP